MGIDRLPYEVKITKAWVYENFQNKRNFRNIFALMFNENVFKNVTEAKNKICSLFSQKANICPYALHYE